MKDCYGKYDARKNDCYYFRCEDSFECKEEVETRKAEKQRQKKEERIRKRMKETKECHGQYMSHKHCLTCPTIKECYSKYYKENF